VDPAWTTQFLFSTELECQGHLAKSGGPEDGLVAVSRFLHRLPEELPSLPGRHGWFTPYGRFYLDCGHLELAACECDDPYVLPSILERMQLLCRRVIGNLEAPSDRLRLANNNHSGLLRRDGPTWGSHENYLVERPPARLATMILPFLATRFYGGAGGVQAVSTTPGRSSRWYTVSGSFITSVRAEFIADETGGSTTHARALHSTCRNEHHQGRYPQRFRYHLLLGDGKRSHFNIALQFGATALALKAIVHDDGFLAERLRRLDHMPRDGSWVGTLQELNVLARPGCRLQVDPRALLIQSTYLEAARRFAARVEGLPAWVGRCLADWGRTLGAAAETDRAWLAAHLDAFAKYELFSAWLESKGRSWLRVRNDEALLTKLTLLDHDWHDFVGEDTCFERAARSGQLDHRVGERVEPGGEAEPWVPEVGTRARARARFLVANAASRGLVLDWADARDYAKGRRCRLEDPFATEFGPWEEVGEGEAAGETPPPDPDFLRFFRRPRRRPESSGGEEPF